MVDKLFALLLSLLTGGADLILSEGLSGVNGLLLALGVLGVDLGWLGTVRKQRD